MPSLQACLLIEVWAASAVVLNTHVENDRPYHTATYKVRSGQVPHMLNHQSARHSVHTRHQAMLNHGPQHRHAGNSSHGEIVVPKVNDHSEDSMTHFLWAKSTVAGINDMWLPQVAHNTRIFRAELCADRSLNSDHYDDCHAFMKGFCQQDSEDVWNHLEAAWNTILQGFCDKFWAIESGEEATTEEEAMPPPGRTTAKPWHRKIIDPVHNTVNSIGDVLVPTTSTNPPNRKPTHIVKPARTVEAVTEICAQERRLRRPASEHCKEYMDEQCDMRVVSGRKMLESVKRNCHDFYVHEEEEMYKASASPGPAPGPAAAEWQPPVDNQKRETYDMPEQGFKGAPVHYDNGNGMTEDWQKEFGPHAAGFQTVRSICMDHPESEWCRLSGYHKPPRANIPAEQPSKAEDDAWQPSFLTALLLLVAALVAAVLLRMSSA